MSIEAILGHRFKNGRLLEEALTHPSCAELRGKLPFNYQRIEFLGDTVLGLAVAELLYRLYPDENEGSLAKRHAALVRSEALAEVARSLGIGPYIHMNAGNEGRELTSNLEDVCEALIGALYLDGGFEIARSFVQTYWEPLARSISTPPKDAKTALQEWAQGKGLALPEYTITEKTGPAHAPEFTVSVMVGDFEPAVAKAGSKRQAEQLAAADLLATLTDESFKG